MAGAVVVGGRPEVEVEAEAESGEQVIGFEGVEKVGTTLPWVHYCRRWKPEPELGLEVEIEAELVSDVAAFGAEVVWGPPEERTATHAVKVSAEKRQVAEADNTSPGVVVVVVAAFAPPLVLQPEELADHWVPSSHHRRLSQAPSTEPPKAPVEPASRPSSSATHPPHYQQHHLAPDPHQSQHSAALHSERLRACGAGVAPSAPPISMRHLWRRLC